MASNSKDFTGTDVEEPEGGVGNEGGTYLMCVTELAIKSGRKREKEVTIGFLV